MCMTKVNLSLKKVGNTFIGTGYKAMYPQDIPPMNKWSKSKPWTSQDSTTGYDGKEYYPGFHIWLSLDAAKAYKKESNQLKLYKVSYKNIVAFGTNFAFDKNYQCVITDSIRYDELLGE